MGHLRQRTPVPQSLRVNGDGFGDGIGGRGGMRKRMHDGKAIKHTGEEVIIESTLKSRRPVV